jgi:hypothetical protein
MPSYVSYAGNGSTTDFGVPFPYLRQADVVVKVNGVTVTPTWLNAALLRVSPAPVSGANVLISRNTPYGTQLVTWQDNGSFKAADLQTDTRQALYAVEEARDAIDLALSTSGNVPAPGAANVGKVLRASGASTFVWSDETTTFSKITGVNGAYASAGLALTNTPVGVLDLNLPADTALVHVSGFVRGDNQSTTSTDLIAYMQVLNASNAVQSTLTIHKSSGVFDRGRYMQGGIGGVTTVAAGNSGWKLRFLVAVTPVVTTAYLYDLSASAMCVQR